MTIIRRMAVALVLAATAVLAAGAVSAAPANLGRIAAAAPEADTLVQDVGCRWRKVDGEYYRGCPGRDRPAIVENEPGLYRAYQGRRIYRDYPGYSYSYPSYTYYPNTYDTYYYGGYYQPTCRRDWHCEHSGPFDLDKFCYWRTLCN